MKQALILLGFFFVAPLVAAELPPSVDRPIDFVKEIRPLFQQHCIRCHGPDKQKGNFRLDVKAAALRGGDDYQPAIKPGESADSPLIQFVAGAAGGMRMPPKGELLTAGQVGLLRGWIDQGADWPDSASAKLEDPKSDWAFQPVQRPTVPDAGTADQNPIDVYIADKLMAHGLHRSPEADRITLIRRLTLILHGMPPTPEEVAAFVGDRSPTAYAELVERLLASPRYGERWAQHWLDVVRYADTTGYEFNNIRKNAWPYRDYVIRALNADLPWDRFLFEQLAGDTVGEDAATGFLVTAPLPSPPEVGKEPAAIRQARLNSLDEMLQNVGAAMLGVTLQCARCHDHKFDPLTQVDYYSLLACLEGVKFADRDWRVTDNRWALLSIQQRAYQLVANSELLKRFPRDIERAADQTIERFQPVEAKAIRLTVSRTDATSEGPAFDEIEIFGVSEPGKVASNVALSSAGAKATSSGAATQLETKDAHLNDGVYGPSSFWIANQRPPAWVQIEFPQPVRVDCLIWSRDRLLERDQPNKAIARKATEWQLEYAATDTTKWQPVLPIIVNEANVSRYRELLNERKKLLAEIATMGDKPRVFAGQFEQPVATHVLLRGDPQQEGARVSPASIAVMGRFELAPEARETERRVALASWIGSPRHPLTARVLVNRIWSLHFGTGIVDTPSDFGRMGGTPTHPELLDWLASEFMRRGWSLKELHRLIANSSTFRQQSSPINAGLPRESIAVDPGTVDAGCRLLWRFPPRRLEAEAIRDSILQVANTLDSTMGGPAVNFYDPKPDFGEYVPREDAGPATWRRMIYLLRARGADDGLFNAFDVPDCGQVRPRRTRSTTPIQALNLFNGPFVARQSRHFAQRVQHEAGTEISAQVERAFQLALNRSPTVRELAVSRTTVERDGLPTLSRVLFNSNEFVFIP